MNIDDFDIRKHNGVYGVSGHIDRNYLKLRSEDMVESMIRNLIENMIKRMDVEELKAMFDIYDVDDYLDEPTEKVLSEGPEFLVKNIIAHDKHFHDRTKTIVVYLNINEIHKGDPDNDN